MKIGKQVIATAIAALALWAMNISPYIAFWGLSIFLMVVSNAGGLSNDMNMAWTIPFAGVSLAVTLLTLVFVPASVISVTLAAVLMICLSVIAFIIAEPYERKVLYLIASAAYYVLMFYAAYLVYS